MTGSRLATGAIACLRNAAVAINRPDAWDSIAVPTGGAFPQQPASVRDLGTAHPVTDQ